MDSQITIHEILHRGQGNGSSDGRLVRNAYRLVMHLGLTGMPLEPTGNFTFNDELAILRNLRRLSLERRDRAVNEEEDGAGAAGDQAGAEQAEGIDGAGLPDSKDSRMSTNPFRDYAAFAWQICEEERKRDLSPDRLPRPLGEMQRHITEREIALQQHRNAALAAGRKTGHDQSEVEQRVVALCEQCRKLLLWEKDAPRLTAEQSRERQQSACCTGDPAGVYLVNLINAFWPLWEKVNDLAAAYDGSAERPLRERTAGQSGAKQPEGAGAGRDPAEGEQAQRPEGTDADGGRCKRTETVPDDEANIAARNYITQREKAGEKCTSRDVAKHCGIAHGRVSGLPAWQAYQARKKSGAPSRKPKKAQQLTNEMLANIGKDDDPSAKLASAEENAWRYLLETVTSEERARLNAMTPAEKAETIQLVIDQIADQDKRGKRASP
jgi:hypothetical protein